MPILRPALRATVQIMTRDIDSSSTSLPFQKTIANVTTARLLERRRRRRSSAPMPKSNHTCDVVAEPLHKYKRGGYHPIHMGDLLSDGRYRVVHKLGWGGNSTMWAARDTLQNKFVAVKVSIADKKPKCRELPVMETLADLQESGHPGSAHVMQMLDHFILDGPNGSHNCLVLELLGPSVPDYIQDHVKGRRLPGRLAKCIAKQALLGLDFLHKHEIGHADLYLKNLVFSLPSYINSLTEDDFRKTLGEPQIGEVKAPDGKPMEPGMVEYLVHPGSYPKELSVSLDSIKIVDLGESFLPSAIPETLITALVFRAPEVIFGDKFDYRVDLWSMGCLLFELFTGQALFDDDTPDPPALIEQVLQRVDDQVPGHWQEKWREMEKRVSAEDRVDLTYEVEQWLEKVYFEEEDGNKDLSREDVRCLGAIISKLLRFEPAARASAREILDDPWFKDE